MTRTRTLHFFAVQALAMSMLAGCADTFYARIPTGVFSGKLDVEWIEPNQFIFRPRAGDPLTYTTSDGRRIKPGLMYTDGGSIPRFLWSVPSYGPWDFAPGYIIHDWLFQQHYCKLDDWEIYSFDSTAAILAEALKTQMSKQLEQDPAAVWAIYQAVKSPVARKRWDTGACLPPPVASPAAKRVHILTIDPGVNLHPSLPP